MTPRDSHLIWHPYSQHGLNPKVLPVQSAQGAYLYLEDGSKLLDAISSWWVNIHGHGEPRLAEAIRRQALQLDHVIFAGFIHQPAQELAELLTEHPALKQVGLSRVFYSDNGSTAVEVALKMAFQYHYNRGEKQRTRFLAFRGSYHGDTLGAMAVGEPHGFHEPFRPLLPRVDFVEWGGSPEILEKKLDESQNSYAAVILEPMVQGAGGMRMMDVQELNSVIQTCQSRGLLVIADEVFTGFYRTGKCFAFEHSKIRPDLLCLSKGISGGILPLAVTLATESIFEAFRSKDLRTAFLHGHSYTANPIACAAAVESWKILHSSACQEQLQQIEKRTKENIERLSKNRGVSTVRCLGTIGAIELKEEGTSYFSNHPREIQRRAIEKNVLLRPLGNVLYAVPPYCCTVEEIDRIYQTMGELAG